MVEVLTMVFLVANAMLRLLAVSFFKAYSLAVEDHPIFPGKDQPLWEFSVRWLEGTHFIPVFDPGPKVCLSKISSFLAILAHLTEKFRGCDPEF